MNDGHAPNPGISREQRLSEEGLARLHRQLASGARPSALVLAQWIRRYGDPARQIIRAHGIDPDTIEAEIR